MGFLAFVLSIVATTIWFNRKTSLLVISGILVILSIVEVVKCGFKYKKANGSPASTLQNDTSIMKKIGMIFLGGILGFAVVQGHLWIRGGDMLDYFRENEQKIEYRCIEDNENGEKTMSKCKISNLQTLRESPKWEKFNGFVQVIDAQKWHTYLVKDEYEKVWRLSSEQNYHLGDQIFLSASLLRRDESKVFDGTIFSPLGAEFWQYSFNYDKWLFMKGIDGTAYEKASLMVDLNQELESQTVMGTHSMEKKLGFVDNVRANLQKYVESIYGQNQYAGLLLGLLIGDKSSIPSENYDKFVDSGLVHIIAVSGGNIAMMVILLSFLLKWIPFYVRNGLILVFVILYAMICGGDSSVVRAGIMASLTLASLFVGREVAIWRLMKYAMIGILIFNPFYLAYDVGLLLSFGAIVGIVLVQKMYENRQAKNVEERQKKKKSGILSAMPSGEGMIKEYVLPTLGATLGTAPVLLFFMKGVNIVGVMLNIVVVAMIPVITLYGFASLVFSALVSWWGRIVPEIYLMKMIYWLSDIGSKWSIFLVAKNEISKYILLLAGGMLGISGYVKVSASNKRHTD